MSIDEWGCWIVVAFGGLFLLGFDGCGYVGDSFGLLGFGKLFGVFIFFIFCFGGVFFWSERIIDICWC